jgi:hypothetical protein
MGTSESHSVSSAPLGAAISQCAVWHNSEGVFQPPPRSPAKTKENKRKTTEKNVPFTGQLNLGSVVARFVGLVARSVVGTSSTIVTLDAEIDFFLSVDTRVGERGGDSSIFPFDVRSAIELNFSLYSRLSSFRDSVTPVRRREDTEGDRDAGVKVQID